MNEKQKINALKQKIRKAKRELKLLKALNRADEKKLTDFISKMLGELFDITAAGGPSGNN